MFVSQTEPQWEGEDVGNQEERGIKHRKKRTKPEKKRGTKNRNETEQYQHDLLKQ
jgi:hypothetical protein